jgi:hypothetical protein
MNKEKSEANIFTLRSNGHEIEDRAPLQLFSPYYNCLIVAGSELLKSESPQDRETAVGVNESSVTLVSRWAFFDLGPDNSPTYQLLTKDIDSIDFDHSLCIIKVSDCNVTFVRQLHCRVPILLHFIYNPYLSNGQFTILENVLKFLKQILSGKCSSQISQGTDYDFMKQVLFDFEILDLFFSLMLNTPFKEVDIDQAVISPRYRFMDTPKNDQTISLNDIKEYPKMKRILNLIYECFQIFLQEEDFECQVYAARHFEVFLYQLSLDSCVVETLHMVISNNPLVISHVVQHQLEAMVEFMIQNLTNSRVFDLLSCLCTGNYFISSD